MRFDIVSLNVCYRGIERSLSVDDLLTDNTKSQYDRLMNLYFEYLDIMYDSKVILFNINTFNLILEYYNTFKSLGVNCEIIVYDEKPIKNAFNYTIELLGVDVVCNLAESLLEDFDNINTNVKKHLNNYGLLNGSYATDIVLKNSVTGGMNWKPCWVYKVVV